MKILTGHRYLDNEFRERPLVAYKLDIENTLSTHEMDKELRDWSNKQNSETDTNCVCKYTDIHKYIYVLQTWTQCNLSPYLYR